MQLNEKCWHLTNGSEIATIESILPKYVPDLARIARQASRHQGQIASLTAQGYLLGGLVALDQLDHAAMRKYSELAVEYSTLAKDYNLHAAALKQQATMFLIMKEPYKALEIYQQTIPFIKRVSPLLRSRIYQGLADASARCGYDTEADCYLGLAHESFPFSDWERDPSFLYADSGLSVLWMYDGLTRLHLGRPRQALDAFLKVDGIAPKIPIGELTQLEFIDLQAQASVAARDQERSRYYLEAAVAKANALHCRWGRTEALETYQDMRLLWPRESQVKALAQLFR
jgi:tetratricopeptide (TPR) repeat protein